MAGVWQALVGNAAVVVLFIFTWAEGQRWLTNSSWFWQRVALGAWFGTGAVATMLLAVEVNPGVYVDLRVTMVAISAFFGGPVAGLITVAISAATRLAMGGIGAIAGLLIITVALVGGLAAGMARKADRPTGRAVLFLVLAAAIAAFAVLPLVPPESWSLALTGSILPLAIINGAATLMAAYVIIRATRYRDEQHLLRAALAQAPDHFYVKDINSRFVAVNDAVAAFQGFDLPRNMIGKSDFDLTRHGRARQLFQAEQALMHGESKPGDLEEELTGSNGERRWFVTSKRPILDTTGATVGLVGVTRDVTAHRKLEDELRASRDLLSHALAEMSDGVAMFNAEGCLTFSNERYRTSFPRTNHVRVPGASLRHVLEEVVRTGEQLGGPQSDPQGWIEMILDTLKAGGEEQVQLFDGRWLHIRTRVASDGGAMVVVSDVTAMKKAETDLLSLTAQLRALASTDALTGLANRRSFDQVIEIEMAQSRQFARNVALLMIDVDHFKSYNDVYGHPVGDECLRKIGHSLTSVVRGGDLAARYGGEEFAVILPDADADEAHFLAEALRAHLEDLAIPHTGNPKGMVSVSIGIATVAPGGEDIDAFLARADAALYAAKTAGRDRVVIAATGTPGTAAPRQHG